MKFTGRKLIAAALASSLAVSMTTGAGLPGSVLAASEDVFPMTVTDQLGREVTIEKQPETLVSGYYISTSLLIALGLEDQLAGIEAKADTRPVYSLAAPQLLELPGVGTAKEFDLEGCAALDPDLVIVPARLKDSIPAMEELGLTVLAVRPENEELLLDALELLSAVTQTEERAEALEACYTGQLETLAEALGDCSTPSVYLGGNSSILSAAGSSMYQNTLVERSGGTNVASEITDDSWTEISYEQLAAWNPDVIFLAADAEYTVDDVLADEGLAGITAVEEKAVYQIPGSVEAWDSPVPGCFLGSLWGASVLHPELYSAEEFQTAVTDFYESFYEFTPDLTGLEQ